MFYFWNICNISDSRDAILIRYISFDSILNFKLDQISSFAFWSNAYAKIRRIMILNSWFHILTSMSHTMDSHASFALNFFSALKVFVIMIRWKCENWWLIFCDSNRLTQIEFKYVPPGKVIMTQIYESSILTFSANHYYEKF